MAGKNCNIYKEVLENVQSRLISWVVGETIWEDGELGIRKTMKENTYQEENGKWLTGKKLREHAVFLI